MRSFFVKIKTWQFLFLTFAVFLFPFFIGYLLLLKNISGESSENFPGIFLLIFFKSGGISVIALSSLLFLWRWTISHYLHKLLPDKSNTNFNFYKRYLIIEYSAAIFWGLLFFSDYIILLIWQPAIFFIIVILVAGAAFYMFAKSRKFSFPYLASKALLEEVPYTTVKPLGGITAWPILISVIIDLQNNVREVYLKYGLSHPELQTH